MNARIFDFRICLLLLAGMAPTARIDAQQPAKNDFPGSTLDEAEIRSVSVWFVVTAFRRCFPNPLERVTTNSYTTVDGPS
jgi:hypothetical protein